MKRVPVMLFGVGGVGRSLIGQILNSRSVVAQRNQCHLDVVGLVDSQSWLWQPAGLSDGRLEQAVADKRAGKPVGDAKPDDLNILSEMEAAVLEDALVVDVTAADGMEPVIDCALERGYGVVLANKKPLAGPWSAARRFYDQPRLRHESTVGGGQPVIATMRYLRDTNDSIFAIEGQLSGTLGYICGRLDEGVLFSVALAEAKTAGYTESDPREDLGGRDVMRKALILARLAGWPLEEEDITVEALYHPALAHLPVAEFMIAVVAMDPSMGDRVRAAAETGCVLRYAAQVGPDGGSVGLKPIAADSPLAYLKYISFRTSRYDDEPLLIGGKGAGVEMTAAGVLGDMISLIRER